MKRKNLIWISAVIVILFVYGYLDPNRFPFPQCPFLMITGWECPGCGSQRALHQFLHGNFSAAFTFNMLFIPTLAYALFAYVTMAFFPTHWIDIKSVWYSRRAAVLILVAVISYWIGRNI